MDKKLIDILKDFTFKEHSKFLTEGLNIDTIKGNYLVSITDEHENGCNTSIENNPTKAVYRMINGDNIIVYSLFQRNTITPIGCVNNSDGNPLVYALKNERHYTFAPGMYEEFQKRFNIILKKCIEQYKQEVVIIANTDELIPTILTPSTKPINLNIAKKLKLEYPNIKIISDLIVKMSVGEVYDVWYNNSSIYKVICKKAKIEYSDVMETLENQMFPYENETFRLHNMPTKYRKAFIKTMKLSPSTSPQYFGVLNDAHVIIIDDTIMSGQSIREVYDCIKLQYNPKTITGITMFSAKVK